MQLSLKSFLLLLLLAAMLNSCHKTNNTALLKKLETRQINSAEYNLIKNKFHLNEVEPAPANLGGLGNKYSMALALADFNQCSSSDWRSRGMLLFCKPVIIKHDGRYILLKNNEDLKKVFAPIKTKEAALSYALLSNSWFAVFDDAFFENKFKYKNGKPGLTYIEKQANDYLIHLFDYQAFGCAHPYSEILAKVCFDGTITVIKKTEAFRDPGDDGFCVD